MERLEQYFILYDASVVNCYSSVPIIPAHDDTGSQKWENVIQVFRLLYSFGHYILFCVFPNTLTRTPMLSQTHPYTHTHTIVCTHTHSAARTHPLPHRHSLSAQQ